MTDPAMRDIRTLNTVTPSGATPGLLLTGDVSKPAPFLMLTLADRETDDRTNVRTLSLNPQDAPERRFRVFDPPSGQWFATKDWSLLVDPASSFVATREAPVEGDAFLSDGRPGISARWGYGEAYIATDGEALPEPNWTRGFIGFRRWSIVVPTFTVGEYQTLLTYERSVQG